MIPTVLALAAQSNWKLHQIDVKKAFFNGDLKDIFMEMPKGSLMQATPPKCAR